MRVGKKDSMNWGMELGCCCKWGGQRKLHKEADICRILKKENHIAWKDSLPSQDSESGMYLAKVEGMRGEVEGSERPEGS